MRRFPDAKEVDRIAPEPISTLDFTRNLERESILAFEQIREIWSIVFLEPRNTEIAEMIDQLDAVACGAVHPILYTGTRVQCDTLLLAAKEQFAAMRTIYAFARQSPSVYFELNPAGGMVYMRQVIIDEPIKPQVPLSNRLFFVMLGSRDSVSGVSTYLNRLIDAMLEKAISNYEP